MRYFPVLCWRTFLGEKAGKSRGESGQILDRMWHLGGKRMSAPMESALRSLAKENAMERKKMSGLQVSSFFSTHMINTTRATSFASGDHKCVWKWEVNVKFPPQSSPTTRILTFLEKQVQGGHQSKLWDCKLMNRHFSPHTPSIFPRLTCNLVFLLLTFLRTF